MKSIRVFCFFLSIIFISFFDSGIHAQCVTISTWPSSASVGSNITISGTVNIFNNTGNSKIQQIDVYVSPTACSSSGQIGYNTTCASMSGSFTVNISISSSATPGTYKIWAYVQQSASSCMYPTNGCSCQTSEAKTITITANTGSLQVDLNPTGAVAAGAQWNVDNGPWRNDLEIVTGLSVGSHTVYYKTISGWTAPSPSIVNITGGNTTCLCPAPPYVQIIQTGSLQVDLNPDGAVTAGAQWNVDNGPWKNDLEIVSGLTVGSHTVYFKAITGWTAPSPSLVNVTANNTTCLCPAPAYTQSSQTGSLQVDLNPDGAVAAGAQWNVDNGAWKNDLEIVTGLSIGSHTVYYKTISGWIAPSPSAVTITANNTTCLCPAPPYTLGSQTGSLQVDLNPDAAVAAGAQWNVDNGAWKNDLETVSGLAVGTHTVYYKAITGWSAPSPSTVSITANNLTCLCPAPPYVQASQTGSLQVDLNPDAAVTAGAQWNVDNGAWKNDLETVAGLATGSHTVFYKTISGWTAPSPSTVNITANNTTCLCPAPAYVQNPQTGSLQVDLNPDGAVAAGAQWNVDNGPWKNDLETVSGITVGSHTVYYKGITGWTAPSPSSVNITANNLTCLCPAPPYIQNSQTGALQVDLNPDGAVAAGAQWNVDNGTWMNDLDIVSGLSAGSHIVYFKAISGWSAPSPTTVNIDAYNTTCLCPAPPYIQNSQTGSLQVDLNPDAAVAAGAQWNVDYGQWNNDLQIVSGLTLGSHTVYYKAISGWTSPSPSTVNITVNNTTCLCPAPAYIQNVSNCCLNVIIHPQEAINAGAQWNLDGGNWQNSGTILCNLSPGSHIVNFKSLVGWSYCPSINVILLPNNTITKNCTYIQYYLPILIVNDVVPNPNSPGNYFPFENILKLQNLSYSFCDYLQIINGNINLDNFCGIILTNNKMQLINATKSTFLTKRNLIIYEYENQDINIPDRQVTFNISNFTSGPRIMYVPSASPNNMEFPVRSAYHLDQNSIVPVGAQYFLADKIPAYNGVLLASNVAGGEWGKFALGVLSTASCGFFAYALTAITSYPLPPQAYLVTVGVGGVCMLSTTTSFVSDVGTIDQIKTVDNSRTIDCANQHLKHGGFIDETISCDYIYSYNSTLNDDVMTSIPLNNNILGVPMFNQWVGLTSDREFSYNSNYLANHGYATIQATPPELIEVLYHVPNNGNKKDYKDNQEITLIDFDIVNNKFTYNSNGNTYTFHINDSATCFHSEMKLIKKNNIITLNSNTLYFDNDFIIDSTLEISTITSLQAFPSSVPNAIVNNDFRLKLLPSVAFAQDGYFQIKIDTSVVYTKIISGGTNVLDTIIIPLSSADTGLRYYSITAQYRPWVTTGPLLSTEITDVVKEINYQIFWKNTESINEINNKIFSIFPNPALNLITITSELNSAKFLIFDIIGKTIKSGEIRGRKTVIDVSDMESGVYVVKLFDTNNDHSQQLEKFIKY